MPYTHVMKDPYGFKIVEFIKDMSPQNLTINLSLYKEFGVDPNDMKAFMVYIVGEKAMDVKLNENPNAQEGDMFEHAYFG